jgi:hypothetical protein
MFKAKPKPPPAATDAEPSDEEGKAS